MLKLLILLECDNCDETWPAVISARTKLGIQWEEEIQTLECEAEQNGWSNYRGKHACDGCVMEAMARQNLG